MTALAMLADAWREVIFPAPAAAETWRRCCSSSSRKSSKREDARDCLSLTSPLVLSSLLPRGIVMLVGASAVAAAAVRRFIIAGE